MGQAGNFGILFALWCLFIFLKQWEKIIEGK